MIYLLALPHWLPALVHSGLESAGLIIRSLVSIAVILPAGVLMGFGFPFGMKLVMSRDARPTPWFWGINGAAGVLASGACSIVFSIDTTLRIGGICYLILIPIAILLTGSPGGNTQLRWPQARSNGVGKAAQTGRMSGSTRARLRRVSRQEVQSVISAIHRDMKPAARTAYGPSPRMRFDIVLNDLCALAWTRKQIAMTSDGSPWRPIVHIEDICEAIRCTLEAPAEAVNSEIFNVGQSTENYRIREIAQIITEVFPGCELTMDPAGDNRSRVPFTRLGVWMVANS